MRNFLLQKSVHKLEASEKRKTKENTILLAGHKGEMLQKSKTLRGLQKLVVGMRDLMFDHAQEEAERAKTIKAKSATIATLTKISESNKKQMIDRKIKFNALKGNLASTSLDDGIQLKARSVGFILFHVSSRVLNE